MIRSFARFAWAAAVASFLAVPGFTSDAGKAPEMTPEQKAEMAAYEKAATPGPQHQKLAETAGTYAVKAMSWSEPGGPAMEDSGTATRAMALDGRVLVEEFTGTMMGGPMTGRGMTGYDNVSRKYWSTWTDTLSTGILFAEGTCDDKNSCTFTGTWNDAVKKGPKKARMTSRWTSPTTEVWEMHAPDKHGKEYKMMEMTYTKK